MPRQARDVAAQFPDGQIYVDLCGTTSGLPPRTAAEVLHHCLRSLGVRAGEIPAHTAEAAARLRTVVAGKRVLFVLDNVRDPASIAAVLPAEAGCAALITARTRLANLDASVWLELAGLDRLDAAELLTRASGRRCGAEAHQRIIDVCEGLPLALRIVAARLSGSPELGADELADRLADRRHRLDELVLEGSAVRGSIQVSLDALRDEMTAIDAFAAWLFPWLVSLPVLTVSAELATAMSGGDDLGGVRLALRRLAELNLLHSAGAGRYGMHDLIRLYAGELLASESTVDAEQAARRGLTHYLRTAAQVHAILLPHRPLAGVDIPADDGAVPTALETVGQATAWLDAELANIVAAAASMHADSFALDAARALHWLLGKRADSAEELSLADLAVSSTTDSVRADRVDALRMRGQASLHIGRTIDATADLTQAVELSLAAGDLRRHAACLADLARAELLGRDIVGSRRRLDEARRIARAQSWPQLEAVLLLNISGVEMTRQDWPAVQQALCASLALRSPDDFAGRAIALPALGHICFELGRCDEALVYLEEGLALCHLVGNEVDGWYGRIARATVRLSRGEVRPALHDSVAAWRMCSPARGYETAATLRLLCHATESAGRVGLARVLEERADAAYRAYSGPANPLVEVLLRRCSQRAAQRDPEAGHRPADAERRSRRSDPPTRNA